jgi:hypothetical protein
MVLLSFNLQPANCGTNYNFNTISSINPGGFGFISGFLGNGVDNINAHGEGLIKIAVILVNAFNQVMAVYQTNTDGYF